jgi:1-acyl-sn-glycerol-3-phosphate acyltransferase|tara:strand:+ start:614 stop:1495 length:882 start_codon:yes stop_codon:yes gene_type:complete
MNKVKKSFIGVVTFLCILFILSFGVIVLSIINAPRLVPNKKLKKLLGHISNRIGSKIVELITASLQILHGLEWEFNIAEHLNTQTWYIAMSNHQSWADIFILLAAGHKKMPLLKFFMKKELQWIPIIYLVHKTIDMPFLNRHSQKQIQANPELKKLDYENAEIAAKRFSRNPSTAFSFAEGTRFTDEKHLAQASPYKNFLIPKIGALAIALKGMPQVNELIDFTVIYSSEKRSAWDFLCGEMSQAKVYAKAYEIPNTLKGKNFDQEEEYRQEFKNFINKIWKEKQERYTELEF